MKQKMMNCTTVRTKLADLLFDPEQVPASVHTHVAACADCRKEVEDLSAMMCMLDGWHAPEPAPFFMTRMQARLRAEREAEPSGWLARQIAQIRNGFAFGPQANVRPVAALSLTVLLLLGSGTYMGMSDWSHSQPKEQVQTAVVDDLRTMDKNAQLLDRLETLSNSDDSNQESGN
ncbi:anti-sigma factor family protein [Telmatobacter bradus]|uniref:anti-sigma factor family protein n=1 Tax=Telmatobacter bradus TaxID=474953 RepID=UPI003B42A41A